MWINAEICGEEIPIMLDCGATHNCIALRCVLASNFLKKLTRSKYDGKTLVAANGKPLQQPEFTIECTIMLGSPSITIHCKFVVIQDLPFSCILGESTLLSFDSWEVSNTKKILTINGSCVVPWYHHDSMTKVSHLNLITTNKTTIMPHQSVSVNTRVNGPELQPFRPITCITAVVDTNVSASDRLNVEVCPSIHMFPYQDCSQVVLIHNNSEKPRVIRKGTKVGVCSEFEECSIDTNVLSQEEASILSISSDIDPIDLLCSRINDLSPEEIEKVRKLLTNYKDIFSVANEKIGTTDLTTFDVDLEKIPIVTTPLRRVPLHHYDIVKELIAKYIKLGLLETIDSPYRASTVLVTKKNIPDSADITDKYRLCTDYRQLNKFLSSPGWPSPSLQQCLDATAGSTLFSSIDFNSGYHQIPCSQRAKQALAFSPGFGFPQLTWSRMPQGVKPASHVFQRTMSYTFKDHEECILPPFFDDVVIKGRDFNDHMYNVETMYAKQN